MFAIATGDIARQPTTQTEDNEKGSKGTAGCIFGQHGGILGNAQRTPGEIAYDYEVVRGLREGLSILKALELAKEKYPEEALQWDDDTIVDIKDHYEYLMNHENILSKLKGVSK